MIYEAPALTEEDRAALADLASMRAELATHLRTPRRWVGRLRRTAVARAIRGSNSIEGYTVELDDADASLDGEEPISADERTYKEILGYRQALGFALATGADPEFVIDSSTVRAMHYMMLSHAFDKSPGQFRRGEIFVSDEATGRHVYRGPEADDVPSLVDQLTANLGHGDTDPLIQGAMAHLNLVMIHPFRDGNGRMARALQTMVLTQAGIGAPELSSIEEWLGAHTEDYYRVLAASSTGTWSPGHDTSLWVSFILRAHHLQAQTVRDRIAQTATVWEMLDDRARQCGLADRALDVLYSAVLGMRVRRSSYVREAEIDERTASRDLKAMVDAGLLAPVGHTRGRHYIVGPSLRDIAAVRRRQGEMTDPHPGLRARLYG